MDPTGGVSHARQVRIAPGTPIGSYVVQRELARGGQGVVYEALHPQLGRFAIKLLFDPDAEARERFLREGRTLARLSHSGLPRVPTLDALPNGTPYLVLELIPGVDLRERVRARGRLPALEAAELVAAVADVLHYCHEQGVVHRDVKPQNVVLTPAGRVVLIDFGLVRRDRLRQAWESQDAASLTQEGAVLGTPAYMPPEQLGGSAADARGDVYSLGATLYHLLTGREPFLGPTMVNLFTAVVNDPPPDPRALAPETPAWLARLCLQAMAKDPAARPASAAALASALRAGAPRAAARSPLVLGLAALGLALAAGGLIARPPGAASSHASASPSLPPSGLAPAPPAPRAAASPDSSPGAASPDSSPGAASPSPPAPRFSPEEQAQLAEEVKRALACLRNPITREQGRDLLEASAAKGWPEGCYQLARWIRTGRRGFHKDPQRARALLAQAGRAGHALALVLLGELHEDGEGGPEDGTAAMRYYRQAAALGEPLGLRNVGRLLVETNPAQARTWLARAAEAGDLGAAFRLASMERDGVGGPPDPRAALERFRDASERGAAPAALEAARLLLGNDALRDPDEAARQLCLALEPRRLLTIPGGPSELLEGLKREKKLVSGEQCYGLAQVLSRRKDTQRAEHWLTVAAFKGHPPALAEARRLYRGRLRNPNTVVRIKAQHLLQQLDESWPEQPRGE